MLKQHVFTVLTILFFINVGIAQSTGTFVDSRDGQNYKTISFNRYSCESTPAFLSKGRQKFLGKVRHLEVA